MSTDTPAPPDIPPCAPRAEDIPATNPEDGRPLTAGPRIRAIPAGDDRERLVCPDCDFVLYANPKIVCGAVITDAAGERVVMARRAIAPRRGWWTLPAGYMENGETVAEGAAREAWEEARAKIRIHDLLAVYSLPHIDQVQMFFRATLMEETLAAGPESLEVALFAWSEIPWEELAFPTVKWALDDFRARQGQAAPAPAVRDRPPGEA